MKFLASCSHFILYLEMIDIIKCIYFLIYKDGLLINAVLLRLDSICLHYISLDLYEHVYMFKIFSFRTMAYQQLEIVILRKKHES